MSQQTGLIRRSLDLYRRAPSLYFAVAAVPYLTLHPALFGAMALFILSSGTGQNLREIWEGMSFGARLGFDVVFLLWLTLPFAVAARGVSRLAAAHVANKPESFGDLVADMVLFLPSALVLSVIASFLAVVGACFFLVPGFLSVAALSLVVPASAVEGLGPFSALRRGFQRLGHVFPRVCLLFFAYSLVVIAALIVQGVLLHSAPHAVPVRIAIVFFCSLIPLVPFALLQISCTLLYFESRAHASAIAVPVTN
jgi:hypothetical protein